MTRLNQLTVVFQLYCTPSNNFTFFAPAKLKGRTEEMTSSPQAGQGSKSTSRDLTPKPPVLPPPPLAAIFVTYFHDTQGPTVIHYITIDETSKSSLNLSVNIVRKYNTRTDEKK